MALRIFANQRAMMGRPLQTTWWSRDDHAEFNRIKQAVGEMDLINEETT